jgi:quercetin dioxygenase-like cupin family protein
MSIAALSAVFVSASFGLTSSQTVRARIGAFTLMDKSQKLKIQSKDTLDIDVRQVMLSANETINWHTHAGPSLVLVKTGSVTMSTADGKTCGVDTYSAGSAFVHPEDAHRFVAGGDGAEIYIVYLLPEDGSPAPTFVGAPAACA